MTSLMHTKGKPTGNKKSHGDSPFTGLPQHYIYHRNFALITVFAIMVVLSMGVIILDLVSNYNKTHDLVNASLTEEANFIHLIDGIKNAEIAAHGYIFYKEPTYLNLWNQSFETIRNSISKLEAFDTHDSSDAQRYASIRNSADQWKSEMEKLFSSHPANVTPLQQKHLDVVNNNPTKKLLWEQANEIYEFEAKERIHFEKNLYQTRNNLWFAFIFTLVVMGFTLVISLYILRQYFINLNEQKELLVSSEARYRGIVEDQTEFISRFTPDGTFIFVNEVYCRFFGKKREDIIGTKWAPVVHEDDLKRVEQEISQLSFETPFVVVENRVIDGRGHMRWAQFVNRAFFDSGRNITEIQSVGRDITELKIIQKRLEDANSLLEERVAKRTHELEIALEKAHTSQRAKENFLAIMSHEIRTPLQSILGFTEMILHTPLTQQQRRYIENIGNQNQALLQLINDILDFSRLESKNISLENTPFNLHSLTENILSGLQPLAATKKLSLTCSIDDLTPCCVVGDVFRIRQVLVNLIGNAIKFTNEGDVTLKVYPSSSPKNISDDESKWITFEVCDSGIGIPENKISDLFKMYSRIEGPYRPKNNGTGLGLAICKQLCDLMGGDIWVKSTENKGSSFFFEIPFKITDKSAVELITASPLHPPLPQASILIVEDNAMAADLICEFLSRLNHKATLVTCAQDAIEQMSTHAYDIVFMDLNLPDLTGDVATSRIRSNPSLSKKPIIIGLSSSPLQEDKNRCLSSGMNDFLLKPISQAVLSQTLQKWHISAPEAQATSSLDAEKQANYELLSQKIGKNSWQIITQTFLEETPSILEKIHHAWDTGNLPQLRHLTHYLQGGADILGAKTISDLCKKILDTSAKSISSESKQLVEQLQQESKEVLQRLRAQELPRSEENPS